MAGYEWYLIVFLVGLIIGLLLMKPRSGPDW